MIMIMIIPQDMKAHHKELEMWYPGFPLYQAGAPPPLAQHAVKQK